ncbi:MAG: hypothetical protein QN128_07805 [Armatimonadota bacterium]|nr:hypothetical protein [Armatimonadota bacterium]
MVGMTFALPIPVKKKRVTRSPRLAAAQARFAAAARECARQLAHLKGTPNFQRAYRDCIRSKLKR